MLIQALLVLLILILAIGLFRLSFEMLPAGHYLEDIQLASKRKSKPNSQPTRPKKEESEMKEENEMKLKEPEHHPYYGDDLRNIFIEIKDKYSPCGDLLFRLDHLTAVKRTGEQAYFSVLYIKTTPMKEMSHTMHLCFSLKGNLTRLQQCPLSRVSQ